jgi:hypothetical protein
MAITLGTNTITGIAAGGLPDGIITRAEMGYSGAPMQVTTVRTRTQASYAVPVITAGTGLTNAGVQLTPLNMTFTPYAAGNRVILEWMVMGEANSHDMVYIITRNGAIMSNSADANRWSGINTNDYDPDYASTPVITTIRFIDTSCLGSSTTYAIHMRSSGATARTFWLNSAYSSRGVDSYEAGVSVGIATEYKA